MTMHPDRFIQFLILNAIGHVMTSQENLNTDVSALSDGIAAIESEVASLKAQPAAAQLDLSGLDKVVARVRGDVPAPAAPAQPTGTPPAAPAGQASGPATGDSIPAPGAPSAAAPAEAAPPAAPADAAPAATTPSGLTPPATGATPA